MLTSSEKTDLLATALSKAQGEFKPLQKTDDNPFFKSKYAGLATVIAGYRDILPRHGLALSQFPVSAPDGMVGLVTRLMHVSGQFLEGVSQTTPKDRTPQAFGSAVTYLRRYAVQAVLGLVPDDHTDDDGNAASGRGRPFDPKNPQMLRALLHALQEKKVDRHLFDIISSQMIGKYSTELQEVIDNVTGGAGP